MSGRLLKKVLKEPQIADYAVVSDDDDSSPTTAASSINPFDLLNDGDDDHQESEPENADNHLVENTSDEKIPVAKATANTMPSSNLKSKKKKKKKGKDQSLAKQKNEETFDVMLEILSVDDKASSNQPELLKAKRTNNSVVSRHFEKEIPTVLQLDPKFLSADNEMRRIFGSKVVSSFQKGQQASSSRQIRGGRLASHKFRKTILVSPSEHWLRWDGSLSMELLESRDGYHYFKYVHSSSYSQSQRAFEAAKAIHDLNGIASILLHHPYHLDSLITMAEYFKFSGEHQMSEDAISKCLYALECAWHSMFSPLKGNCILKYNHESNRPLFSTLFTHMKNMNRRGCHRCALEICKLLLSLDPDDPMGALFCIDYFSLRAEEYAWLEQFSDEYRNDSSLWLFPNFSYSLAICRFYLEGEASTEGIQGLDEKLSSSDLLKQALMLHPTVLKKLVDKVPLKDQAWTNILKNKFFKTEKSGSLSLDHLINIYVERSYIVWRLPELQKLLKNSAMLVIESLEKNGSDAKDLACVREEAFSSEKNEYSHLLVSDFSDTVPTMPPEMLQNFMVDPRLEAQIHEQQVNPPQVAREPHDIANRNPLAVLFESMLPWVDYGGRDGDDDVDNMGNGN